MKKTKIKPIKVTQKELAKYLGVYQSTIASYKKNETAKKKLFLMLKGLKMLKYEKQLIREETNNKPNS